jgi:hypothetical protein
VRLHCGEFVNGLGASAQPVVGDKQVVDTAINRQIVAKPGGQRKLAYLGLMRLISALNWTCLVRMSSCSERNWAKTAVLKVWEDVAGRLNKKMLFVQIPIAQIALYSIAF